MVLSKILMASVCVYDSVCKRKIILTILMPSVICVYFSELVLDHCVT